ncbi:MAG: HTH domain-containing protein [Halolamina sp.]
MTTDSIRAEDERAAILFVRSLSPNGARAQQDAVIERLEELADRGRLDSYTVRVWGRAVGTLSAGGRTEQGRRILDRVDDFEEWAAANGKSVGSFFETREQAVEFTDETRSALVLPTMALAEYAGGEIRFVTPCTDGQQVYTVPDRVDELDAGMVA